MRKPSASTCSQRRKRLVSHNFLCAEHTHEVPFCAHLTLASRPDLRFDPVVLYDLPESLKPVFIAALRDSLADGVLEALLRYSGQVLRGGAGVNEWDIVPREQYFRERYNILTPCDAPLRLFVFAELLRLSQSVHFDSVFLSVALTATTLERVPMPPALPLLRRLEVREGLYDVSPQLIRAAPNLEWYDSNVWEGTVCDVAVAGAVVRVFVSGHILTLVAGSHLRVMKWCARTARTSCSKWRTRCRCAISNCATCTSVVCCVLCVVCCVLTYYLTHNTGPVAPRRRLCSAPSSVCAPRSCTRSPCYSAMTSRSAPS